MSDRGLLTRVPVGNLWMVDNPRYDWRYDMEPDPGRDGHIQRCHSGRVLGGGSSINGMIHARGAPADFDDWAAAGAKGWSYGEVLPYFCRAESRQGGNPAFRGLSGPLAVEDPRSVHASTHRFLAAAREIGMPAVDDYNDGSSEGIALAQLTQRRGSRESTSRAYRSLAKDGLIVRTRAVVTRLLLDGARCVGVAYHWRGETRFAHASNVVLCAGAIASPKLLMLSGIGDRSALEEQGIKAVRHLPGVGRNLAEHIGAGVGVHVTIPTYNAPGGILRRLASGVQWLATRRGPASTPLCQAVAFCRSAEICDRPDLQLMFSPVALGHAPQKQGRGRIVAHSHPGVGIYVDLGRPRQRGQITLRSADPAAPPRIRYELLGNAHDVASLILGCRIARRIFAAPSFRSIVADERFPGAAVSTDAEWRQALKSLVSVFHHPTGTCAMGSDDQSVVDPRLRVHGIDNLRIADASVMPTPINGNTNAATIMIAERAAEWLGGMHQPARPGL